MSGADRRVASSRGSGYPVSRRTVLRGTAGAVAAGVAATAVAPAAATPADEPDYGGWFDNTSNYDGTVDETGRETVTIIVGASGNNGHYAFEPPAVRVDPGTEIVWEWSGKGSVHNVVDEAGAFESETTSEAGHTFTHTVDEKGITKYACRPHEAMGMKGAIVAGSAPDGGQTGNPAGSESSDAAFDGWFEDVGNYTGTVDRTGRRNVTITVGAEANGGPYAFDPPAVRIDPGTTVTWEWSGEGGVHNVAAADGSFESIVIGTAGFTFERTIETPGVRKYSCVPPSRGE